MTRILVIALAGIALAGLLITGWRAMAPKSVAPPPVVHAAIPQPMVSILVAAHDLSPGTQLRPGDLSALSVVISKAPPDAWRDTAASRATLLGALVRRSIIRNSTLDPGSLLLTGDHGFLAALLAPGMRAFTIQHDQIVSGADLIWPGDHIDLVLTQDMPKSMQPARGISAETVLSDLRVLAVGRQLFEPLPGDAKAPASQGADAEAVTVEVSPADAEKLAVALRLGRVAFAVRPPTAGAMPDTAAGHDTVWADGVMHSLDQVQPSPPAISMHVFEGVTSQEYKF